MIQFNIFHKHYSAGREYTVIRQEGDNLLKVGSFLSQPFRAHGNMTYTQEPMEQVLCDVILGLQLYNIRHRQEQVVYEITARYPASRYSSATFDLVRSLIAGLEKQGNSVSIQQEDREPDNLKNNTNTEGALFDMDNGYEIHCPSFSEYAGRKHSAESGSNGQSAHYRRNALDFAHPVDSQIIRILDNPTVNQVFSKLVDLSTDMNYGLMLSTGIRMDNQPSEIAAALKKCASVLNIPVPYTVISSALAGLNAATVGTDGANCIAVSSLLKALMNQDELIFVLGHECGHIALGHVLYHTVMSTVRNIADLIPLVGHGVYQLIAWPLMAWYRRSEISADRAGLLCCGDIDVACRALLKLESGFMNVEDITVEDYIQNTSHQLERSFLGKYQELLHEHPILAKRMEALRLFAQSEKYYRLSGKPVPQGITLISDQKLDEQTEKIIQIMK